MTHKILSFICFVISIGMVVLYIIYYRREKFTVETFLLAVCVILVYAALGYGVFTWKK